MVLICAWLSFDWLTLGLLQADLTKLIIGLMALPASFGLALIFVEKLWLKIIVSLGVASIFLGSWGTNMIYLICAIFLVFFVLWGFWGAEREKKSRIKIMVDLITGRGISGLLLALATILSIGFYYSPIPQSLIENFRLPAWMQTRIIGSAIPGFNADVTLDQTINLILGRNKDEPVPEETRQQIVEQLGLSGLELSGDDKISDNPEIPDQIFIQKIQPMIQKLGNLAPLVLAILLWEALVFAQKLVLPLIILFDVIIYQILKSTGFLTIQQLTVNKEIIKL